MWYIVGGVIVVSSIFINRSFSTYKRKKEERQNRALLFETNYNSILNACNEFRSLCSLNGSYFSYHLLTKWKSSHRTIISKDITSIRFDDIDFSSEKKDVLEYFNGLCKNHERLRKEFNTRFCKLELDRTKAFFDDIDGKSLDYQQREAIVRNEDNNLVIAGAGCGKTTTIMGKVKYLNEKLSVNPQNILLISFTRKSANDLLRKVNLQGIRTSTFHKLGLGIISQVENRPPSIYDQNSLIFIKREFQKLMKNHNYLSLAVDYFTNYLRIERDDFETENFSEHVQHLKDQNFRPYKSKKVLRNGKETYLREIVKSQEECKIANFLLFHGVKYEYEQPYELKTYSPDYRQYSPDFSIYQGDKRIYLEHYGIDENGEVPPFFANESKSYEEAKNDYHQGMQWKRTLHSENNTICLETFSYQFKSAAIYDSLKRQFDDVGIIYNELRPDEKWKLINDSASEEVEAMIGLFNTFLSLFKSNNCSFEELQKKAHVLGNFSKKRTHLFLALFRPIYDSYQKMLKERNLIDYSDMINIATNYVNDKSYQSNYSYILVDEFQDISLGRYKLLRALKDQNQNCKLFAVGDDWQSIYRFTGSDITLFNRFEKYFGYTNISKIETTYRFGKPLLDVSSRFIMQNPNQIQKDLKSKSNRNTYLGFYYNEALNDDTKSLESALSSIVLEQTLLDTLAVEEDHEGLNKRTDFSQEEFLLLGRYNFDIDRIDTTNSRFRRNGENSIIFEYDQNVSIELNFLTVHRAKGLEADYVLVLNCNSGKVGFPSEIVDDPVLSLLLGDSENYQNSEERRLFYVALTRARKKTICISDTSFPSKFILEIDADSDITEEYRKCPRCKSGNLILKKGTSKSGKPWAFNSCSNFAIFNCDYKEWLDVSNE